MRAVLALVAAATLPACAADLGAGGGATFPDGNPLAVGRVAASARLTDSKGTAGVLFGAHAEGRGEGNVGSRFSMGASLGYGSGPPLVGSFLGWEAFADAGTPLRGGFFTDGMYLGATVQVPVRFDSDRPVRDMNDALWIVRRRFELVPFVRGRVHVEWHAEDSREVVGGVSGRFRFFSDLL